MSLAGSGVFVSSEGGANWQLTLSMTNGFPVDVTSAGTSAWVVSSGSVILLARTGGR
jgi:hypothetical protein